MDTREVREKKQHIESIMERIRKYIHSVRSRYLDPTTIDMPTIREMLRMIEELGGWRRFGYYDLAGNWFPFYRYHADFCIAEIPFIPFQRLIEEKEAILLEIVLGLKPNKQTHKSLLTCLNQTMGEESRESLVVDALRQLIAEKERRIEETCAHVAKLRQTIESQNKQIALLQSSLAQYEKSELNPQKKSSPKNRIMEVVAS